MKVKANIKDLLVLFWTFFKIGLFTFGGGYAMIPLIERDIVEKRGGLTSLLHQIWLLLPRQHQGLLQ